MPKGTNRAEATSKSEKNKARSISHYQVTLAEDISKSVSQY